MKGFPDHPHRGQATVTYMLEGSSRHEDSAGHKGTIVAGGVQWMCAVSVRVVILFGMNLSTTSQGKGSEFTMLQEPHHDFLLDYSHTCGNASTCSGRT